MVIRRKIEQRLSEFRTELESKIRQEDHRATILEVFRSVDEEIFVDYLYQQAGKDRPDQDWKKEAHDMSTWGLNEALRLLWNDAKYLSGIPLFPSTRETQTWSFSVLKLSRNIRLIEFCLEMERVGLGVLRVSADSSDVYELHLSKDAIGAESIERADGIYLNERNENRIDWPRMAERHRGVMGKMFEIVDVWNEHFITYGASPEIDLFYHNFSSALMRTLPGSDVFREEVNFGGIPFKEYVDCVRILIGFALKHLDFCSLLIEKYPDRVKSVDLVSVPCAWKDAVTYLGLAMDIPKSRAEKLLLTTSITSENFEYHLRVPCGPLASHYLISKDSAIRSIRGCLENPYQFMLRELRRLYPKDWDSNVDERENIFREELKFAFSKYPQIEFLPKGLQIITTDLRETDIDAVAYDGVSGVLGLIQLKWQDLFGSVLKERESKKRNFLEKSNEWVDKVVSWCEADEISQRLRSAGLSQAVSEIKQVRIFVIGRSFSYFSGDCSQNQKAAWGNWAQVVRLMDVTSMTVCPLSELHQALIDDSPKNRAKGPSHLHEIVVAGITLKVFPFCQDAE
ncbi:MAG: hypothetical protein ABJQ29_13775 [Luteolibacter sp.]